MNERVDGLVYCPPAKQVVARHIVLLPYAVGTVFALTAVGIRPGLFDESHIGGSRERKAYTGRLDGADYQLHIGIVLEGIDGCLFVCRRVAPGDCNRFGEELQQLVDNLMERAEDNEFLAVFEERADEIHGLCYLAERCKLAQCHKADQSLHTHLATYLPIGTLGIGLQIGGKVGSCQIVFCTVGDFDVEVDAGLVGQLGQDLCFLTAYHAGAVEAGRKLAEITGTFFFLLFFPFNLLLNLLLFRTGKPAWFVLPLAIATAISLKESGTASEIGHETPHNRQLGDEVGRTVDHRRSGQQDYPFLAHGQPFGKDGLLSGGVFDTVAFVDDDASEHLYLRTEYHVFEAEGLAALDVPYKELTQALVIYHSHMEHPHFQEIRPCSPCRVVENECLFVGELFELTLPVYLERGGADDKAGVCVCRVYNTDALQGFAQARFVTNNEAFLVQAVGDTLSLVRVRLDAEMVF